MLGAWIDRYWIWVLLAGAISAFASVPGPTSTVEVADTSVSRPRAPWVILPGEPVSGGSSNDLVTVYSNVTQGGQGTEPMVNGSSFFSLPTAKPKFVTEPELTQISLNHFDLRDRSEIAIGATMSAVNQAESNDLSLQTN